MMSGSFFSNVSQMRFTLQVNEHFEPVPNAALPPWVVFSFTRVGPVTIMRPLFGGIAQLGERLHGMQEVSGSIPLTSTKKFISRPHRLEA